MSKLFTSIAVLFIFTQLFAQSDESDRITISFEQVGLVDALQQIDLNTTQQLSYNPHILPSDVVINKAYEEIRSEELLQDILGDKYQLKTIGNYIVIQRAPEKQLKTTFQIKGGIRDATTGQELQDVTIYELNSLQSTLSDETGSFDIEAQSEFEEATFVISKRFYQDTVIRVSKIEDLGRPIELRQQKSASKGRMVRERVRTFSSGLAKFFTSVTTRKNAQNVNFVDSRPFQISLIPSIGTNRKMSSQIRNNFSLNLISGYGYGVRGVELGGVYNIDREEVRGVQIGGLGNAVGGEVHGLQAGGFMNTSKDYVNGMQVAGFFNLASDSVNGFQASGFMNITRDMGGFQVAGFSNHTQEVTGLEVAGFINTSKVMDGVQVAGFINVTKVLRGLQIGVINIADSVESGGAIGLVNIVKKRGFISPAIETNDVVRYRFAMRTGVDKLYTILSAGITPNSHWTYGLGFGSRRFLSSNSNWYINPELYWINISEKSLKDDDGMVVRLNVNVGNQLFKRLSITTGPSLNFYATRQLDELGNPLIDIASSPIMDKQSGFYRYQLWVGYSLGIGF